MIYLLIRCATSHTSFVAPLLWTMSLFSATGTTFAAAVGDQVELRSTHPAGVPFHDRDRDVLVLGDYNTMGTQDTPAVSAQEELAVFDGELAPRFRRLSVTPACTEYFEGKAGALDHIVASTGMQEVAASARVTPDAFPQSWRTRATECCIQTSRHRDADCNGGPRS
jgi:hypothetical protein